jgi:16S rRNA methyltransferase GidB
MKLLKDALGKLQIPYSDEMISQFHKYMEEILIWNDKVNLTSITEKNDFEKKHFVDSVVCCGLEQFKEAKNIIDVGTGAGFPGIPLAILNPDKNFLLLDSLNKRIRIISDISASIGVTNVTFCHGRAEEFAQKKEYREQFDLCVSRAVANLAVLSEYCLPFIRVGGWFAAYKSAESENELLESGNAIRILGGRIEEIKTFRMEGFDLDHNIILIKKVKNTLAKYPRKAGMPAKEPLK